MIKIENVLTACAEQMNFIIESMRNPMNSWDKSDSEWNPDMVYVIGDKDFDLMQRLSKAGTDHRKFMRMIPVYARITAGHTWWAEFDTYKVGTVRNSCSKMHKIHVMGFEQDNFDHEGIDEVGGQALETFNKVRDIRMVS